MKRRPPARRPIVVDGPLERGAAALAGLMDRGAQLPEIALTGVRFADEYLDQAAKSPAERVLGSRVVGMFEAAAAQTLAKWRADGESVLPLQDPYLSTADVAALVGRRPSTVARWRQSGSGPSGSLLKGRVWYRQSDVLSWIDSQKV